MTIVQPTALDLANMLAEVLEATSTIPNLRHVMGADLLDSAYQMLSDFDHASNGITSDADGMGGDFFPAPSDEALEWARNFNAAMEAK